MVELEQCPLFRPLSAGDRERLRQAARERRVSAGGEIFKEGDGGDGMYVVRDGRVQIAGLVAGESRHVFVRVGPGDIFGEMAVLEDKPRSATAIAEVDTSVYFIPRDVMLELIQRSPELARALLREISARLREFNQLYIREVLQAERLTVVGKFARSIIHDLKNPLNVIGLSAEMASSVGATEDARARANLYIRRQVERITDMINEVLEFTQGSPSAFSLSPTDYAAYMDAVLHEIGGELGPKSIVLAIENAPPPERLLINPRRLRHLFHNLIHNAVEAMPEGGRITVRFQTRPDEVVTEIGDTGPGIAPEIADRLFEPFATYGKRHGTGLGLSICRKILEDHRGWITARNSPRGGAVFAFGLPRPR